MSSASRITHRTLQQSTLRGLNGNLSRMQTLQEKLSSGREVSRPSDSPVATVSAMRLRSGLRRAEQHSRNAQDGLNWLGTADATLTSMLQVTARARELVLRAANASMGAEERQAVAAEIDALRENAFALANTRYLDRPIFAGTASAPGAYDASGAFLGVAGDETAPGAQGKVERTVAAGVSVRVNVTGPEVFGAAGDDLFSDLARVAAHLRSDDRALLQADIGALDTRSRQIQNQLAKLGARYHEVEVMRDRVEAEAVTMRSGLSDVENIDLPKTIVDLQLQQVAYQAALSATARVIQPSLLDFLR
ncbi:MAG: flagellar hook-associated protein FlgL [Actinomycetota bacterium]|nr:flagellar hook-associated protein FlgL [Actinomycetota bacterium]